MPERTVATLPVSGDIIARYLIVRLSGGGTHWEIVTQRFYFEQAVTAALYAIGEREVRIVDSHGPLEMTTLRVWAVTQANRSA